MRTTGSREVPKHYPQGWGTRPTAATKPNIVFILVDNVGWGDLSAYGGTVPTPHIDSIAWEASAVLGTGLALVILALLPQVGPPAEAQERPREPSDMRPEDAVPSRNP